MPDVLFHDFETLGPDIGHGGGERYVTDPRTQVLIWAYAFDSDEPKLWFPGDPFPEDVREFIEAGGYTVAFNAGFDRKIWQYVASNDHNFPYLSTGQVLCAMTQAQASNLPGNLDGAAAKIGKHQKDSRGKQLIKLFCLLGSNASPEDAPEEWQEFCNYALDDIRSMRDVWYATRPLALEEWQEYWASENINDRGFAVDVPFCERAAQFYALDKEMVAEEAARLTGGVIPRLTLTQRINNYVYERLPPEIGKVMVTEWDKETGDPLRFSLRKDLLHMLVEDIYASDTPVDDRLVEFLELMEDGRSSAALKYRKMADQHVDGRMHGSYVFNGAGQTGRFSSRGVQTHNLRRDRLVKDGKVVEGEVYNMIIDAELETL